MSNPAGEFEQKIIISAGSSDGIRLYDAVVTDGASSATSRRSLRDQSRVTMLTDQESAVTARDVKTGAIGILGHGEGSALILDRVPKQKRNRRTTSSSRQDAARGGSARSSRAASRSASSRAWGRRTSTSSRTSRCARSSTSATSTAFWCSSPRTADARGGSQSSRPALLRGRRPGDHLRHDRRSRWLAGPRARHPRRDRSSERGRVRRDQSASGRACCSTSRCSARSASRRSC